MPTSAQSGPTADCSPDDVDFCSAFCAGDADCDTTVIEPGQHCVDPACENGGGDCTTDLDCSTAACAGSLDIGYTTFTYCAPKA